MEPSAAKAKQRREGDVRDNSRLAALETWHIRQAQADAAAAAAAPAVLAPPPGYALAIGVASANGSGVPDDAPPAYDAGGVTAPSKAEKTAESVQPTAPPASDVDDEALTQSTPLLDLG